jgi:hypothetical protein
MERLAIVRGAERQGAPGVGLCLRQVRAFSAADWSPLEMETGELGVIPCRERISRDSRLEEGEVQLQDFRLAGADGRCLGARPSAAQHGGRARRAEEQHHEREPAE